MKIDLFKPRPMTPIGVLMMLFGVFMLGYQVGFGVRDSIAKAAYREALERVSEEPSRGSGE